MPGARRVAVRIGRVAFLDPLTATVPRSFRPPSIQTSSMPVASLDSWVAAGAAVAVFVGSFLVLVFTFIGHPAVFRSRSWASPQGRAQRAPRRDAGQIAPCMDRPDPLRSPV